MPILAQIPPTVLNRIPINQPRQPRIANQITKPLVTALRVLNNIPTHHLIIKLPQSEGKPLPLIVHDHRIAPLDQRQRINLELLFDI
jgi:hypothetical protein